MASFKFFIKSENNPSVIYARFYHGRKIDFTKSTSLLINPKFWNNTKGVVKQIAEFDDKLNFQKKLNDLKNDIVTDFNSDFANGIVINSEWLETQINKNLNRKVETDLNYFINYAENYLLKLPSTKRYDGKMGVTKATLTKIKTVITKVSNYEKHFKKKLLLTDINLKFHENFIFYLHNVEKLNFNTVGKYIQFVKTIVYDAKNQDFNINSEIEKKEFKPIREKTTFVTLSENEIDLIFNHNFDNKPSLDNARNWLIIGVWTGARAGDLLNFTEKKINNNFIEYVAQKTDQKIVLPLHWQVKAIIEKCNGLPHKISTQKYNDYIKLVCSEVGLNELIEGAKSVDINNKDKTKPKKPKIFRKEKATYKKWELVSTHIARRSFATNHYGKLPTPVLMSATGHTTEKMFLNYIGKSSIDNAEILRNYWNKIEQIKDKKPVLKIAK
jgi:integrase